jgi:hypothetical protein
MEDVGISILHIIAYIPAIAMGMNDQPTKYGNIMGYNGI